MNSLASWLQDLGSTAGEMGNRLTAYLPNLFGALVLLAAGWIAARLARRITTTLGDGLNRLLDRSLRSGSLARMRFSARGLRLAGNVIFWLVILFFVAAATRAARLDAFSSWLDRVIAYLPTLLAGGLIILAGYLVSALVRDVTSATAASAGAAYAATAGRAAQAATFLTAIIIGIDQVGIDITFLVTVIAIALAAVALGISLAFALGARDLVSNLVGAHYLRQQLQPGQPARIDDVEGEVLEITATSVILSTSEGRVNIPARVFHERRLLLRTPPDEDPADGG